MTTPTFEGMSDTALERMAGRLRLTQAHLDIAVDESRLYLAAVAAVQEQRAGGLNILGPDRDVIADRLGVERDI